VSICLSKQRSAEKNTEEKQRSGLKLLKGNWYRMSLRAILTHLNNVESLKYFAGMLRFTMNPVCGLAFVPLRQVSLFTHF